MPWFKNWWSVASSHCKWRRTAFENGRISNFQGLVTLTFDRVILHTVVLLVHHSSTSTYIWNRLLGRLWRVDLKTHLISYTTSCMLHRILTVDESLRGIENIYLLATPKHFNRSSQKFAQVTTSRISTSLKNFIQIDSGVSFLYMRDFQHPKLPRLLCSFFTLLITYTAETPERILTQRDVKKRGSGQGCAFSGSQKNKI